MSSYDSIYKTMAPALEPGSAEKSGETHQKFDPARQISPTVAHELNNIFTVIQGYADRLLFQHGENPAIQPHLKMISEASKRATMIVRDATPPNASQSFRQNQNLQPPQPKS